MELELDTELELDNISNSIDIIAVLKIFQLYFEDK